MRNLLGLSERPGQHLDQLRRTGEAGNHGHGQGGDAADEHPAQILHVLEERLDRAAEFLAALVQLGHRVVAVGATAARDRQGRTQRWLGVVCLLVFLMPVMVVLVVMGVVGIVIVVFVVVMIRVIMLRSIVHGIGGTPVRLVKRLA